MFAALRTNASRSASTHSRLAARRIARVRIPQRYQSTNATNTQISGSGSGSAGSYFAAGVGGGVVVLLGAYSYYHFSGVKQTIDSAQVAHDYIKRTTASIAEKAPKSPNEILQFLRSVAKTYAGVVPGLSSCVDSTFDSLDELHETHGEELNKVLEKAYEEIKSVLKDVKENETLDTATAGKLVSALSKCAGDLNELGKKVGNDAFKKLEESYPAVAQTIGTSYDELKGLAQRGGPEARKLAEESIAQIQDVLKTSGKNQEEAWKKAKELVQGKTQKLKELAWDKAAEEAKENPEVTKLLKESKDTFLQQGVSVSSLGAVLDRIKTAVQEGGLDQGKLGELKDFVQDKAREAQSKGWGSLQQWVKTMPGGDEALKKMSDVDIQALMELSKNKTGDAKQLAEETYRDVLKVLQEKAAKAKKITDASVSEAKSKTS